MSSILQSISTWKRPAPQARTFDLDVDSEKNYGTAPHSSLEEDLLHTSGKKINPFLVVSKSLYEHRSILLKLAVIGVFYGVAIAFYGTRYGWSSLDCGTCTDEDIAYMLALTHLYCVLLQHTMLL
jgi:hypothetical protein